ncbi:MAG: hypothetical protein IPH03_03810 [Tetrasphaera sp.]|nr:hypothetical protein [Tetrasphaera sp.]
MSAASPRAPKRPFVRTLHGESVEDLWHWMRDHEDPDLVAYLSAERAAYDVATAPRGPAGGDRPVAAPTPARAGGRLPLSRGGWTYQRRYDEGAQYPTTSAGVPAACRRPSSRWRTVTTPRSGCSR